MKERDLKRLIERYYNGESTDNEDKILRDYFSRSDVPQGYEAEKIIFSYYNEAADIPEPTVDFEARILAGIDASDQNRAMRKVKRYLTPLISVAAGLLLLAGTYFIFMNRDTFMDTYSDPEIAYAETIKILRDVSSQLNRGVQVLEPVVKINEVTKKSFGTINKSTRIVDKSLKSLSNLKKSSDSLEHVSEKYINK